MRNATTKFLTAILLLADQQHSLRPPRPQYLRLCGGTDASVLRTRSSARNGGSGNVGCARWRTQGMAVASHIYDHARCRRRCRDAVAIAAAGRGGHRHLGAGTGPADRALAATARHRSAWRSPRCSACCTAMRTALNYRSPPHQRRMRWASSPRRRPCISAASRWVSLLRQHHALLSRLLGGAIAVERRLPVRLCLKRKSAIRFLLSDFFMQAKRFFHF